MSRKTPVALAASAFFGGSLLFGAAAVLAQDAQRIEITGSHIRRLQAESASPVQTLSREDIEKSGKASVAELLQSLAVDNQGSVPTNFGSGFASGASGISLRGMGAASTLVLLNGRRVAPYGLADDGQKVFADLNMIPMEAVERIEIAKDGASAVYGSDAIAGVVNIILRKNFNGTAVKLSAGTSAEGDGRQTRAAITTGFGDFDQDGHNLLFNLELGERDPIWNRDRAGRGAVGRSDLRDLGFDASTGGSGGGFILGRNSSSASSINGNVRNPATLEYWNRGDANGAGFTRYFPGAACSNFTQQPQGDPGYNGASGCLVDVAQRYGQIQPSQQTLNFFGRGALALGGDLQGYLELNHYRAKSTSSTSPSAVSSSQGYPGGPVSGAAVQLGASHPDNPYFGSAARLRYIADDVGPRVSHVESDFSRLVLGVRGSAAGWYLDSALLHSQSNAGNTRTGYLQRDVAYALLDPSAANVAAAAAGSAAYAALPAGSTWRIAENAGLNSAALYAALSPTINSDSNSKTTQIDLKASRDLMDLDGGALALALGAELRRESIRLEPTTGTERGNVIGLGFSAYEGQRSLVAGYAELLAPLSKAVELSAALRADRYSDVGSAFTPKLGIKFTPWRQLALRATYGEGFRAPSAAENGRGGLAAFSSASDPVRCALGVSSACSAGSVAVITSPNPDLVPEKSKTFTLGLVLEPAAGTYVSMDLWQVQRRDEINQESTSAAIAAGKIARDPSTATQIPGDPGAIVAVLARYINSSRSTVRGLDVDLRQALSLGGAGKLGIELKWTHLFEWSRDDPSGVTLRFDGTHGNCDVTNCIGTPADRLNLGLSWEAGAWRVAAAAQHRAALRNVTTRADSECATFYADGSDAPNGCRIGSFTSWDLNVRWQMSPNVELFGGVQNLFDRVPPLDTTTYGATAYNPLDYSGAVGRYVTLGMKARF
jgi:iron complex outermembrane recepter protein